MPKKSNKQSDTTTKELPSNVADVLYSTFGYKLNEQINDEHGLSIVHSFAITQLQNDLFFKKVQVSDIVTEIMNRLGINEKKSEQIALDILGKKMLLVDKKWFGGEVSLQIKELGGDIGNYKDITNQYIEAIIKDTFYRDQAEQAEKQKQEGVDSNIVGNIQAEAAIVKDPEGEKKASIEIFSKQLRELLYVNDYILKIELNTRLLTLILDEFGDGQEKKFHSDLMQAIKENEELITQKKISVKGQLVAPTVANWIKDFVREVGMEGAQVNSLKKAKYLSSAENIKGLSVDEKRAIGSLFFLYTSLESFYANVDRFGSGEVLILQLTAEEQQTLKADVKKAEEEAEKTPQKFSDTGEAEPVDIMQLYLGRAEDRDKINDIKQKLSDDTRREYDKIADYLEEKLKLRYKLEIIAAIELLAETGALDDMLARDQRYQEYMFGFFKRNNLQGEEIEFKKDPYQAKFVQFFLRFVFMERLGMNTEKSARIAANISQIFLSRGVDQYAQLAYLDLTDHQFKWSNL